MILADKIINERKKNGWSQEELAEKLGVSRQSVSKWEGAQSVPDMQRILEMSRIFGVSCDYLLKEELEPEEIAEIAAGIEPTDGIFYPGIVRMNYMTGELLQSYGNAPKMIIAMFDTGGTINTIEFHSEYHGHENSPQELLDAIDELDRDFSAQQIGKVATLSALANQRLVYKPQLEEIIEYAQSLGALGVNVAHSGTMMGVLFAADESMNKVLEAAKLIGAKFPHLEYFETERLISGGYEIEQR